MRVARVVSVNVGTPVGADWAGDLRRTAIRKHPVDGPVRVGPLGVDGDQVADTRHHGGTYQAVYAFAREDLDTWAARLGQDIPDGQFGENLTTAGIDVNEAWIGEHWRIGTTVLEVIEVRIPCNVFKGWMHQSRFDDTAWVKRFTAEGRPGPYLRVVQPGVLAAGDALEVVHRPDRSVTVSTVFRALTTDRHLLPTLLDAPVSPRVRLHAEAYVDRQDAGRR
jgi:MOSC domain-containing protein YiiM